MPVPHTPGREKLVLVQALRALAALLVAMHHAQHEAAALAGRTGAAFVSSRLLPWAAGVDVFFVISGFIIVHTAAPLYRRDGGRRVFLAHRVARVVPLYWLVTSLYLATGLVLPGLLAGANGGEGAADPAYIAASFLFWPALRADGSAQPLYGLGWTLNFEMFFYACFALCIGLSRRGAVAAVAGLLGALVVLHALVPALPMPLAFWSEPLILEFALGAGLGLARAQGVRLPGWLRSGLAILGVGLLALVAATIGEPGGFLRPLTQGLPAALLVAAAALGREPAATGERSRLLLALSAVGDASYALYLIHPFVLRAAREALLRLSLAPVFGPERCLWLMLALTVPAALLVHRLIERPLTRAARAVLDPRPAPAAGKTV